MWRGLGELCHFYLRSKSTFDFVCNPITSSHKAYNFDSYSEILEFSYVGGGYEYKMVQIPPPTRPITSSNEAYNFLSHCKIFEVGYLCKKLTSYLLNKAYNLL